MRAQTEERKPSATIPVGVAQRFSADLAAAGGGLNAEVANRLRSQVTIAELTGVDQIDLEAAIEQALIQWPDEPAPIIPLPTHRSRVAPPVQASVPQSPVAEEPIDDSVEHLVDLVIDLR